MSDTTTPDTGAADTGQPDPGAAELDALTAQAHALEGTTDPTQPPPPPPVEDTAAELLAALELARMIVSPAMGWWADYARVWNDATLKGIADNGAVIMARQGWTMGDAMSKWGPYIGLAGATIPAAAATYAAVRQHRAQVVDAPARPVQAAPAGPAHPQQGERAQPAP